VIIYKYDISNIKNPVLVDEVHQEGNYNTTRKVGNIMYIFTNMFISYEKGVTAETVLPEINGELVDAKDVYICEDMRQEFITSSINLGETDEKMEVIDSMVIMNSYAEVYMGLDGLYLYESNYNFNTNVTNTIISKFGYKGGYMTAINCTTINGTIRDKFAINEKDENLRVLLTETKGGERSNKLVIYDAGLNYVSEIDGIAENEEIYAARYIGDIAYFITYRNTDPLFAVDVSDITNPKMLGYLEITGFSEYIHPYGEGKLLGIGYETDPDTGTFIGVKLVMFDISNPSEMKILGTKVLEGYDDVSVFYEYKDITISPEKNIIGIDTCEYMDYTCNHIVYKWTENGFEEIINKETDDIWFTRSVYIEDDYYILENGKVSKYDLSNPNSYITLEYE
ncbi:MAG: beta-propeller domain-containing protein, partial [Agathobacter sp.]|nr:beta-propeller domain-containing protein [Agathobacter sp.]